MLHAGRKVLATLALIVTAAIWSEGISGAEPPNPSPIDEQTQGKVHSGSVRIDREKTVRPRTARNDNGTTKKVQPTAADMMTAFCDDRAADAAASGDATQTIVDLCHGFASIRVTAPSREQVFSAFRELGLYRGVIQTDPRVATLVNLETYFWCGDGGRTCELIGEGERTVTLLGQPVRIRPRILAYRWDFGDGAGQEISAGKATHTYAHAMTAAVTLTLTWTADYAVGTGAFQDLGDTTTTTSPARALPVREAESVLITGG